MAYFKGTITSKSLQMETELSVVLPQNREDKSSLGKDGKVKVLYLFHGLTDNATGWIRRTSVERYASKYNVAVIMPEVQRSFYTNMRVGVNYFDYVAKELPLICSNLFNISMEREDVSVGGLSMGGYGALKCALTYPEQYSNCAAFSSAADIVKLTQMLMTREEDSRLIEFTGIFGDLDKISDEDDLFALASNAAKLSKDSLPRFFMTCGLSDGLLDANQRISSHMTKLGLDLLYKEWEGEHNWEFWDDSIKMAFEYFYR